jgi:PAS domain S-box-containing protein
MRLAVAIGIAYVVAAWLGLALLTTPENVAVFWPASGIAAGVLIVLGYGARLPVTAGVMAATIAATVMADKGLWSPFAFALCNAGEALLTAWLVERWFGPAFRLEDVRHVLGLLLAGGLGPALAAVGAAAAVVLLGQSTAQFPSVWRVWFASHALGIAAVAPLLIGIASASREGLPRRELIEGTIALVALAVVTAFVLVLPPGPLATVVPTAALLPLVLWVAARCRPVFAAAAAAIIAGALVATTTYGVGRFGDPSLTLAERALAAQIGVLATAVFTLVLAALFAALRESEARLRSILDAANVIAWEVDLVRDSVRATGPAARVVEGWQVSNMATSANFIHPEDRDCVLAEFRAAVNSEAPYRAEFRLPLPGGGLRWVASEGTVVRAADGRPLRMLGINHDITERKTAEEALRESEARFRSTFENAAVGIGHVSLDRCWLRVNDTLCRITGYTRDELLARRVDGIDHPEDVAAGWAAAERLLAGEVGDYRRQKRCVRKDGTMVWVAVTVSLARKPDGSPNYFISVTEDITKAKEDAIALQDSNRLLDSVIENLPAMVFMKRAHDLRFVRWNRAGEKLLGFSRGDVLGRSDYDFFSKEQADFFTAVDREVLASDEVREIGEEPIRTRDGDTRYLKTSKIVLRDASGAPTHVLGVSIDITERKESEEHVKLLMREISHRAKNLLSVVQVMARHTAGKVDPQVFAERFGDRLAGLAASHDLLVKSDWRGVDTADLVRSQLAHFGDLVGTRVTWDGPLLWLRPAAAQTIGMALRELATNAAKYGALSSAEGSIRIEWDIVGSDRDACFRMRWSERGGPVPEPPTKRGFGHTVMVEMIKHALDAGVRLDFPSSGAVWELVAPLEWPLGRGMVVSQHANAGVESRGQWDAHQA